MANIPSDPIKADYAYRDAEILKKQIKLLKEELDLIFTESEKDLDKMCKLQIKAIERIRKKFLETKKRFEQTYKTLGLLKKGLKGDYSQIFIDFNELEPPKSGLLS